MQPDYKTWSMKDIAEALSSTAEDGKKLVVPKFQRNLVWSDKQKKDFIDSVKNGYPVGTLLLYNKEGSNEYSIIDGLQRSTTMLDFVRRPTTYFDIQDISDDTNNKLYNHFKRSDDYDDFSASIGNEIRFFIRNNDLSALNITMNLAVHLNNKYGDPNSTGVQDLLQLVDIITPTIEQFKKQYESIIKSTIISIVYQGEESNLPLIFERINNQGTQLGKYQIYAASWAISNYTIIVENDEILKNVLDKYDDFINEGYEIKDYDRDSLEASKEITVFEYVLGFGKYIVQLYKLLFEPDKSLQEINPIGFELLNACFGCSDKDIKTLHEKLHTVGDVNKLEDKVLECIQFVQDTLNPIIGFKGNKRTSQAIYHSHYQIISIIASVFREKYDVNNLDVVKDSWKTNEPLLKAYIPQHYVFDILSRLWGESGQGKLYSILIDKNNKYLSPIDKEKWDVYFDLWFNDSISRREKVSVANTKSMDKLFLICIYNTKFTAADQLSSDKFDIEHLATKEQLKKFIKTHNWEGLPISCIGNLCYLPEYDNRKKKQNTLYQDKAYLDYLNQNGTDISAIENKYSFTKKEDMDWLNNMYADQDYEIFLDEYKKFLGKRFKTMKKMFYKYFDIDTDDDNEDNDDQKSSVTIVIDQG